MNQSFAGIGRANGLGRQACRSKTQEEHKRKDDIEDEGAQHEPAEQGGVAQPADDCDIDETHQRLGNEGERCRQGNSPHIAMRHLEGTRNAIAHGRISA